MEEKKEKSVSGGQKANALKHGLTSKALLTNLSTHKETIEIYNTILEGFRESFKPKNFFEETLIERMTIAQMKMWRYEHIESEAIVEEFSCVSLRKGPNVVASYCESLLKYKGSNESQFYKAIRFLIESRQNNQID